MEVRRAWRGYGTHPVRGLASEDARLVKPSGQMNVKQFRGGLVFKNHRLLYHSTLGLGVIKKKKRALIDMNVHRRVLSGLLCPTLYAHLEGIGCRV